MLETLGEQFSFNQIGVSFSWPVVAAFFGIQLAWIWIKGMKKEFEKKSR